MLRRRAGDLRAAAGAAGAAERARLPTVVLWEGGDDVTGRKTYRETLHYTDITRCTWSVQVCRGSVCEAAVVTSHSHLVFFYFMLFYFTLSLFYFIFKMF